MNEGFEEFEGFQGFRRASVERVLGAALLACGLVAPAGAQVPQNTVPPVREAIVVTATVTDEPEGDSTRTVAVLTREDLERVGVASVVDALRLAPGLDPRARGAKGVQTDFSIRGATFGQSLLLVDGIRLNNSQSGHHNGEIPTPLAAIDRIEVVYGSGSSVHGADALGGTINVISRRGSHAAVTLEAGQHGYAAAEGSFSGGLLPANWTLTGWGNRSSGFMFDREFAQGGTSVRGAAGAGVTIDVRHQRRAFGANGFYGNSPSKEWTDQTLGAVSWQHATGSWVTSVRGYVRNHHDHFLWDINRPGFAENRHRTDAAEIRATAERVVPGGGRLTAGMSVGSDWIASSNLGDHDYQTVSVFGEALWPIAARASLQAGLRLDRYSTFGASANPAVSIVAQPRDDLRLRASVGHAFRIPTFTELYYSDPAHRARNDLTPEQGWSVEAGADWMHEGWTLSFSPFRRWDEDVIDWVKPAAPDLWRTTNVRDVTTTGFEASVTRRWNESIVRIHLAGLKVDAPSLDLLSKYVLEYARRQSGALVSVPLGGGARLAINVDHRLRLDGQSYALVGLRLGMTRGPAEFFVSGTNMLDETYEEVAGVAMPGRWMTIGLAIR